MLTTLQPAALAFDESGTPYSPQYGDVYHSADSGPGQARHVFLGGNGLPERWAGRRAFTILETGFGFGLSFLCTWQAWRAESQRPERLHFVSIEKHPFAGEALGVLHQRYPEIAGIAAQLRNAWPQLVPGLHRLHFDAGHVTLTLALGDVAQSLPRLRVVADAFFLDGFAPERNPEMWTPNLVKDLARRARPGATFATYTAASSVRDALAAAGFEIEKREGFGRKREMLVGRYAPRFPLRRNTAPLPSWDERHAIVIGAGRAGAAVSERLASRGWCVDLLERAGGAAKPTPNLLAGVYHPLVSRDDSVLARLSRAGFLYALRRWRALDAAKGGLRWQRCGVLQLARSAVDETRMAQTIAELGFPSAYAEYLEGDAARRAADCEVAHGGVWFPEGGWMAVRTLIAAQLALGQDTTDGHILPRFDAAVHAIQREGTYWQALAADGHVISSAPVLVLANSHDAARLTRVGETLRSVRGQTTYLPASAAPSTRVVLTGNGHLLPPIDDTVITGSSYDFDDDDSAARTEGHAGNLERLSHLLGRPIGGIDVGRLGGGVGFRCVAPDRLPLIGAMPDWGTAREQAASLQGAHAPDLPRLAGLYGAFAYASRGLIWSALGGEIIASLVEGEPAPVEGDLLDVIDPGRFMLKRARRGRL